MRQRQLRGCQQPHGVADLAGQGEEGEGQLAALGHWAVARGYDGWAAVTRAKPRVLDESPIPGAARQASMRKKVPWVSPSQECRAELGTFRVLQQQILSSK